MADKLFLDTGALYAYFDKSDAEHKKISSFLDSSTDVFYTSNFIIDELVTLLRCRNFKVSQIKSFIDNLRQGKIAFIIHVTPEIEDLSWEFLYKYKDHDFSFTDCTSFVAMRENGIKKACALDDHFKAAGFSVLPH